MPATTTLGLGLLLADARGLPACRKEWAPYGIIMCGLGGMVAWPVMLRVSGLAAQSAMVRGFALGSVSHISGMVALQAAGDAAAAEWAAVALVLVGAFRVLLFQLPVPWWTSSNKQRQLVPEQTMIGPA